MNVIAGVLLVLVGALAFADASRGDDRSLDLAIPLTPSLEVYRESVPVSGGVVRGLMSGTPGERANPDALYVQFSSGDWRWLCVEISSQDGRYHAIASHEIRPSSANQLWFSLNTPHAGALREYGAFEVAVLAGLKKEDCEPTSRVTAYAVASWGKPTPGALRVLINSGGLSDTMVRVPFAGGKQDTACVAADGTHLLAYDTICNLDHIPDTEFVAARVLRKDFDSPASPIRLPISVGAAGVRSSP